MIRRSLAVRSATIAASAVMLIAYVVFSQTQETKTVAPGSKYIRLDPINEGSLSGSSQIGSLSDERLTVLPGSKGSILVLPVPKVSTASPTLSKSQRLAPGSKSAEVFNFQQKPTNETRLKSSTETSVTNNTNSKKNAL